MMMNKLIFQLFCLLIICFGLNGQDVNLLELQEAYPLHEKIFLNFDVEVIVDIKDGQLVITEENFRSKILLDSNAKKHEEESIKYYDIDKVIEIEANSQIPNGKKYKKYEVTDFETIKTISNRYFHDDSHAIQFDYPNVQKGAICNVNYLKQVDNPIFAPSLYLASYLPIKVLNVKIIYDEDVDLLIHEFNIDEALAFETTKKKGKIIKTLSLYDVEEFDVESGGRSISAQIPHIALAVASYSIDGRKEHVMGGLKDLYMHYSGFIEAVDMEIDKNFETKVDSIIAGIDPEEEKVKAIFEWVQDNIKYIAFEDEMGGFIPRNPLLVFNRRFGDCKDMSSIIVRMLQHAGIEGHFAWVGTRDLPYKYNDACGMFIDNHMMAAYYSESRESYVFLDATNEFLPFGLVPSYIQEKDVLIYKDSINYEVVTAGVTRHDSSENAEFCNLRLEGNKLVGQFNIKLDGYERIEYLRIFNHMSKEQLEKRYQTYFAKGSNKSTLSNIETHYDNELIDITYDIVIDEYVAEAGDEIYVNMNLDKVLDNQKVPEHREQAIDLERTINYTKSYSLEIPQGYKVSYVPENASYRDGPYSFDIKYEDRKTEIKYEYVLIVDTLWLEEDDFESWNTFVKKLKKSYRENIVLSKI